SALFDELTNELTVPETYFFRHATQFDLIRSQILPEVRHRAGFEHTVRCWSAGCSTGEEAYSIAIALSETGLGNSARVIGTDISLAALAWARAGKYRAWSLRGEGAASAGSYLRTDGEWKVVEDAIRRRVTFLRLNLAQDCYPSSSDGISDMDLILCRNVLIYFDEQTVVGVARRLFNSLACGGWLLTAAADPILAEHAPFEVIVTEAGLLYRHPLLSHMSERSPTVKGPSEIEIHIAKLQMASDGIAPNDPLAAACYSFSRKDFAAAAALTQDWMNEPETCALHIRALANLGNPEAAALAEQGIERYPLYPELYYLLAHLRLLEGDHSQAILLLRKVIYLAPTLIMAHFVLGSLLRRSGDLNGAHRHFRNVIRLAEAQPPDEIMPMSDGETADGLAAAARKSLQALSAEKIR
ncbi:MAG: chemotaxis protein CheR, partial [Deltaproteobacteria bacterium]|nr:chemotaxis protein CheR [Deltaproteobacteria bacterium]